MAEKQNMKRMKELIQILNQASKAYYDEDREIMSNFEYDKLYDELVDLEKETGITLSNSPTINVGYEVVSSPAKRKASRAYAFSGQNKGCGSACRLVGRPCWNFVLEDGWPYGCSHL